MPSFDEETLFGDGSSCELLLGERFCFFISVRGLGETSCSGGPLGFRPGDASSGEEIDIGVPGGKGIGCRGARGDRGTAPGKAPMPRGDMGGELTDEWEEGFLGSAGEASPLSIGLGLIGRPGLINGGDNTPEPMLAVREALSMPANEPALESSWDPALAAGGDIGIVGRGLNGIDTGGDISVAFSFAVFRDFDLALFFDRLLNSASL